MADYIDRQAAIDAIEKQTIMATANYRSYNQAVRKCAEIVKGLPSAPREYKTDHGYMWLCPECGLEVHSDFDGCVRCGWKRKHISDIGKKVDMVEVMHSKWL